MQAPCDSVSLKPFWSISSPLLPQGVSYLFLPSFYWLAGVHLCFPLKGQLITGRGYHKSRLTKVSLGLSNITLNKHGPLTVRVHHTADFVHFCFWSMFGIFPFIFVLVNIYSLHFSRQKSTFSQSQSANLSPLPLFSTPLLA